MSQSPKKKLKGFQNVRRTKKDMTPWKQHMLVPIGQDFCRLTIIKCILVCFFHSTLILAETDRLKMFILFFFYFRKLLYSLSEDITDEDLQRMKFLLYKDVPRRKRAENVVSTSCYGCVWHKKGTEIKILMLKL